MDWDQVVNATASALVALASTVFMVVYHLRAPWRESAIGRHIMAVAGTIGLLGLYTVAVTLWPDGPLVTPLRVARTALLLAMAGLMVQRTCMVLAAQRRR